MSLEPVSVCWAGFPGSHDYARLLQAWKSVPLSLSVQITAPVAPADMTYISPPLFMDPKRFPELLHVMKPSADFIGVLVNPNRPGLYDQSRELQQAADRLGVRLTFQNGASDREIDSAFEAFVSEGVQALLVTADPLFNPAIYQWREFVSRLVSKNLNYRRGSYSPGYGSLNRPIYFSVTSGKLKGSHLFASVVHASRNRL